MEIIGETLDDAIGETFDKCGKMIGLPYPAGPHIDKYSKLSKNYMFLQNQVDEKLYLVD